MQENVQKFVEMLSADEEVARKAEAYFKAEDLDGLCALAAKAGIQLTADELKNAQMPEVEELDDDELEAVAGGWKSCYCVGAGGGKKDSQGKACACIAAGGGDSKGGRTRCFCFTTGYGYDTGIW